MLGSGLVLDACSFPVPIPKSFTSCRTNIHFNICILRYIIMCVMACLFSGLIQLCVPYMLTPPHATSVTTPTEFEDQQQAPLDPGQIAGIVIAAVVFVLLHLIFCPLLICYLYLRLLRSKKVSATQETPQSNGHPIETTNQPATQPGAQTIPKSRQNDRQQFLKGEVCRPMYAFFVLDGSAHSHSCVIPYCDGCAIGIGNGPEGACFSLAVSHHTFWFLLSSTLNSMNIPSFMKRVKLNPAMRYV